MKSLKHVQFSSFFKFLIDFGIRWSYKQRNKIDIYWLWPPKTKSLSRRRVYIQCNSFFHSLANITYYAPCWIHLFSKYKLRFILHLLTPPFLPHVHTDPFSLLCPAVWPRRLIPALSECLLAVFHLGLVTGRNQQSAEGWEKRGVAMFPPCPPCAPHFWQSSTAAAFAGCPTLSSSHSHWVPVTN